MAKVNLVNPTSGSVGGITYSHNKGGAYIRKRSIPTNPQTTRQQTVRTILATLSSAWASLTSTQQGDWTTWAESHTIVDSLGLSIIMSGQQAFVQLNARVVDAGGT